MVKRLTVTIADSVYEKIERLKKPNRSEFTEELLRIGLAKVEQKK